MTPPVAEQQSRHDYFASFTDLLVGLLFLFIILLVSYSLTYTAAEDKSKAQEEIYRSAATNLKARLEGLERRVQLRNELLKRIANDLRAKGVAVSADTSQGVLRFHESVLFQPNQAVLDKGARDALDALAYELLKELPCYSRGATRDDCRGETIGLLEAVYIEGHTDKRPTHGRYPSNWELSSARAIETYKHLVGKAPALLSFRNASNGARLIGASAYAETRPVHDESHLDENRRIDFRFLLAPPSSMALSQSVAP